MIELRHTKTDLLSCVRRLKERGEGEDGGECTRDDDVEAVVERQTSDVDRERDVDVMLGTAFVLHRVTHRRHL